MAVVASDKEQDACSQWLEELCESCNACILVNKLFDENSALILVLVQLTRLANLGGNEVSRRVLTWCVS
jgi:hypothetical protein